MDFVLSIGEALYYAIEGGSVESIEILFKKAGRNVPTNWQIQGTNMFPLYAAIKQCNYKAKYGLQESLGRWVNDMVMTPRASGGAGFSAHPLSRKNSKDHMRKWESMNSMLMGQHLSDEDLVDEALFMMSPTTSWWVWAQLDQFGMGNSWNFYNNAYGYDSDVMWVYQRKLKLWFDV